MKPIIKSVDLNELPIIISGRNKGGIDWKNSIGKRIFFKYANISGELTILEYDKQILTLKYLNKTFNVHTSGLLRCNIGKHIGYMHSYNYQVGDEIKGLIIKKQIRNIKSQRLYICECKECGNKIRIYEDNLIRDVSPCRHNLYYTNPELLKYFPDGVDQMVNYTKGSKKKINPICPICNRISRNSVSIHNLVNHGFRCSCQITYGSYGERFFINVLEQLNVSFETQVGFVFENSIFQRQRVDFLVKQKYIVEIDGLIGHGFLDPYSCYDKDCNRNADINRDNYLLAKGYEVIRISYDKSFNSEAFIKNIKESKFGEFFSLKNVDFKKAENFALTYSIKSICDDYNRGFNNNQIQDKYHISSTTRLKYLKYGNSMGWCNYNVSVEKKKGYTNLIPNYSRPCKAIKLCEGQISYYNSVIEASKHLNIKSQYIGRCCRGERKSTGGYSFEYI